MNNSFLRYFITEEIYVLKSEFQPKVPKLSAPISITDTSGMKTETDKKAVWSKHLLIITDDFRGKKIPSVERELLLKIMKALKIDPRTDADVISIENFDKNRIGYPQKILILATSEIENFSFPKYQPAQLRNIPIISADSLAEMIKDVSKKRQLWAELKRIFKI